MPYLKKAKDEEGAIAEAIATELTYLSQIPHPARDKPSCISVNQADVTMPTLKITKNLSDLFERGKKLSKQDTQFLESLGRTLAFNWYVGQGDLNVTNISISGGKCYPYDFDCAFQSIQSAEAFARTSQRQFEYKNLDGESKSDIDIITSALLNIQKSAETAAYDVTDHPKWLQGENLEAIQRGFQKQLIAIGKVNKVELEKVVDKHQKDNPQDAEKYKAYLAEKTTKALEMSNNYIRNKLENYIARADAEQKNPQPKRFFSTQARINQGINLELARRVLEGINKSGEKLDKAGILKLREDIMKEKNIISYFNSIHSKELNSILSFVEASSDSFIIRKSQMQRKDESPVVKKTLTELPMTPEKLDGDFLYLSSQQIYETVEKKILENEVVIASDSHFYTYTKAPTEQINNILVELEKLKDKLGGSPNFLGGTPSLKDPDENRSLFGVPMPAVKDWLRMTLRKEWAPPFFWKKLNNLFKTGKTMSQYEEAHIRIQRFGVFLNNKENFKDILDRKDEEHYSDLSKITGLAWHPTLNGVAVEKMYFDFTGQFLTAYFEDAKSKGEEALIEYFKAFEGVCFEDRARALEEYAKTHPLGIEKAVDMSDVADWDSNSTAEEVFMKETVLIAAKIGDAPTPTQLFDHLSKKGIFGREFTTDNGTKVKPTEEKFKKWASEQVEMCTLSKEKEKPKEESSQGLHRRSML